MLNKLRNGWELALSSWQVLMADKEMMVFPMISGFAALLIGATFALPLLLSGGAGADPGPIGLLVAFVFYLVQYSVVIFFNSALVAAALKRLDGGDPTVGYGLRMAWNRLPAILGYAAIAAVVGVILKAGQRKSGWIKRLLVGTLGVAWTLVTYLVVPVLVANDIGPLDAVKRSGELLKKTWGEQLVGAGGIGMVTGLATVLLMLAGVPVVIVAAQSGNPLIWVPLAGLLIGAVLIVAIIGAALKGIYQAALYRYATTGNSGFGFSQETMQESFVLR